MITMKEKVKEFGACNFCSRGILKEDGSGLIYPYDKVFVLCGNSLVVRVCQKCLEIIKKINTTR